MHLRMDQYGWDVTIYKTTVFACVHVSELDDDENWV